MSARSQTRLLLNLSSPTWSADRWLALVPRGDWMGILPEIWKLAENLQTGHLLKELRPSDKKQLEANLALFHQPGRKKRPTRLKTEVLFLVESASLRIAESLGKELSWQVKKKWLSQWFKSTSFLKLTEAVLYSDECLDRLLGLFERKVQHQLKNSALPKSYEEEALYLDLAPEDLYTPYRVICRWGKSLKLQSGSRVVDLGSGVGRLPLTLGLLHPQVSFTGIEIMKERSEMGEVARRGLKLRNVKFVCENAAKKGLPPADYYYLFNPFVGDTLRQVFRQLKRRAELGKIRIAVAQIELPWTFIRRQSWLKRISNFQADRAWEGIGISLFESI